MVREVEAENVAFMPRVGSISPPEWGDVLDADGAGYDMCSSREVAALVVGPFLMS